MLRILGVIVVLGLWASCGSGGGDKRTGEEGEIEATYPPEEETGGVSSDTEIDWETRSYDFGEAMEGDTVSYVFKFTNTGPVPLVFSNVKASCGCTVPEWPREPIAPGESSQISARFNTAGRTGTQRKEISIIANTDPALTVLELKGEVVRPSLD